LAVGSGVFSFRSFPTVSCTVSSLNVFLFGYLGRYAAGESVKHFLDDAATYSHQLNVVLPLVAALGGAPRLPDHIRGLLNRLRRLRNQIVHGKLKTPLSQAEIAELLCSALFAFRYVDLVQSRLAKGTT
jgi:hypothetical protein